MKITYIFIIILLFSTAIVSAQENFRVTFHRTPTIETTNKLVPNIKRFATTPSIFAMPGGGGMGGTGSPVENTIIASQFDIIKAMTKIKTPWINSALLGGGGMGGTGRYVDFIVQDGELLKLEKTTKDISIIFNSATQNLEDIELKSGEIITVIDIQNTLPEHIEFANVKIAVPIREIRSVLLSSGQIIEQSSLIQQHRIATSIQNVNLR